MQKNITPKPKTIKPAVRKGKRYLIGNWKMNPDTITEAKEVFTGIKKASKNLTNVKVVVCPPYVYLSELGKKADGALSIGAQNVYFEQKGSFTGEVSVDMLKQFGVNYVIVGHSERRARGETDADVAKKARAVLASKLNVVVCIGEGQRDSDAKYLSVVAQQLAQSLSGIEAKQMGSVIIAYEPVWAIGAKEAMSSYLLHQMVIFIQKTLISLFDKTVAEKAVILYGGSVNADNAGDIVNNGEVQGLLVGRESLRAESFAGIINAIK